MCWNWWYHLLSVPGLILIPGTDDKISGSWSSMLVLIWWPKVCWWIQLYILRPPMYPNSLYWFHSSKPFKIVFDDLLTLYLPCDIPCIICTPYNTLNKLWSAMVNRLHGYINNSPYDNTIDAITNRYIHVSAVFIFEL